MSMWLNLAKITPDLLAQIRTDPQLLDAIFFSTQGLPEPSGFDSERDVYGYDYRIISDIAAARAAGDGVEDWQVAFPALAAATTDSEVVGEPLDSFEFTYGCAVVLTVTEVAQLA